MWPRAYTVRPQVYMRTVLPGPGVKSSSVRLSVLNSRSVMCESVDRTGGLPDLAAIRRARVTPERRRRCTSNLTSHAAVAARLRRRLPRPAVPARPCLCRAACRRCVHALDQLAQQCLATPAGAASTRKVKRLRGHVAGFYSESRSKSTRARSQSAAICTLQRVERLEASLVPQPLHERRRGRWCHTDRGRSRRRASRPTCGRTRRPSAGRRYW